MATPIQDSSDRLFLVEFDQGILTIVPLGDFESFQWPEMEAASKAIFVSIQRDPDAKILVDMGRLRYCGSALLGIILKVWKSVSPRSGVLAFCNVNAEVADILKQTRLDTLWTIYPTREAATAALQPRGA
jgi:anti-sigma B factor antagonist